VAGYLHQWCLTPSLPPANLPLPLGENCDVPESNVLTQVYHFAGPHRIILQIFPVLNYAQRHEDVWGSEGIAPRILWSRH
jgi:hypothetical protein